MESARTQINSAKDKDETEENKKDASESDGDGDDGDSRDDSDDEDEDGDEAESIDTGKLKSFIDKVSSAAWGLVECLLALVTNYMIN